MYYSAKNQINNGLNTEKIVFNADKKIDKEAMISSIKLYQITHNKDLLNEIIESNYGMILDILSKIKFESSTFDKDDAFQVAVIALIECVNKFDTEKYDNFTNYAYSYIKGMVITHLNYCGRTVRINPVIYDRLSDYNDCKEELFYKLGKEPTEEEIIDYFQNVYSKNYKTIDGIYTHEKIAMFERYNQSLQSISLYSNIKTADDDSICVIDTIADNKDEISDVILEMELYDKILNIVGKRRAVNIICKHYGICGYDETTLEELGKEYGITKQRICNIIKKYESKIKEKLCCKP